jgi:hypothetical protein
MLDDKDSFVVSMSTTFYPRDDLPADIMIITSPDNVLFAVHRQILLEKSTNNLGGLLDEKAGIGSPLTGNLTNSRPYVFSHLTEISFSSVGENASVFNLFLHAVYGYNPAQYEPSLGDSSGMLDCLSKYGVSATTTIAPGTPMYNAILKIALSLPLDTFSLVCHHELEQLAVEISHNLVNTPLHNLQDQQCLKMGPIYLRRLIFLHLGRTERLKTLLKEAQRMHESTVLCDEVDLKRFLLTEWEKAAASLLWDLGPNTSGEHRSMF